MSSFPRSPRLLKGAIIGLDLVNPLASIIVFQYNPDTLTRKVTAQAAAPNPARGEALRLKGPAQETIDLTVVLDAADQLEQGDGLAAATGLFPVISALEMLVSPKVAVMIANEVLARAGIIEILPSEAPLTLFVWGPKRIVPVRLTQVSITEEAFDPDLNPILAKVTLSLNVLTHQDLGALSAGGAISLAHQVTREALATIHGATSIAGTFSVNVSVGG